MREPYTYRNNIPFFYQKAAVEFQKDKYERFEMVEKSLLSLCDSEWIDKLVSWGNPYTNNKKEILEIGCGIGQWIASIAAILPSANCWGLDFSYQMLRQSDRMWVRGMDTKLNVSHLGFNDTTFIGRSYKNLSFGLANAEDLPFTDNTKDLILNSFLIDRLDNPAKGLKEMYRVLEQNGILILITPFNFQKKEHWQQLYPSTKLCKYLEHLGFEIITKREFIKYEYLDFHRNRIEWKSFGIVAKKI